MQEEIEFLLSGMEPRLLRTMREFAEQEIVIPDGPFKGRRFSCDRQPFTGTFLNEIDSGKWRRVVATGPSQTGKTLVAFVIPTLYHLFERGDNVICGLPDMDMARDKWEKDFLPVIEATRYKKFLPTKGAGSRGGSKVTAIKFTNGTTLRFMSGGGGDKGRAGYTAPVLVITETDGFDESAETSREGDKISQLEARVRSFGERARIYMECTLTTELGRTWREYTNGSASLLALHCPVCNKYSIPERGHLKGWEDAQSELQAEESTSWHCPECDVAWTEDQRRHANENALLIHGEQSIEGGQVVGNPPETRTLGFRWRSSNSFFLSAGQIGVDEWKGSRDEDTDNAEKILCQFVHGEPYIPDMLDLHEISFELVRRRLGGTAQGIAPSDTDYITAGIDMGKYTSYCTIIAHSPEGRRTICDYWRFDVPGGDMAIEKAFRAALLEQRDRMAGGYLIDGSSRTMSPSVVLVDSGYEPEAVTIACNACGANWWPTKGFGATQDALSKKGYQVPKTTGSHVKLLGEGWHIVHLKERKERQIQFNADHWKSAVHNALSIPHSEPNSMVLFNTVNESEHRTFARHLTAEKQVEKFMNGRIVQTWERVRRDNHFLDSTVLALLGSQLVRAIRKQQQGQIQQPTKAGGTTSGIRTSY